ncbi:uncharacterized protein [Palaemon carinicauda]|uniref:uncharacterized protein n=1 Tax=Palaemon carinicauda TaxID=392227 RepID=UPI0035B682EB
MGTLMPEQKRNWKTQVASLVHAYNSIKHETTGFSPHYLMFGKSPHLAVDLRYGLDEVLHAQGAVQSQKDYISQLEKSLQSAYELASAYSTDKKAQQKKNYDLHARSAILREGDKVLIRNVAFTGTHKLADRWQPDVYVVISHPNSEVPVYVVKPVDKKGPKKTLHWNLLLPLSSAIEYRTDGDVSEERKITDNSSMTSVDTPVANITDSSDDSDDSESGMRVHPRLRPEPIPTPRKRPIPMPRSSPAQPAEPVMEPPVPVPDVVPDIRSALEESEEEIQVFEEPVMPAADPESSEASSQEEPEEAAALGSEKPIPPPRRSTRQRQAPRWLHPEADEMSHSVYPSRVANRVNMLSKRVCAILEEP